jgi:dihydrofolate reductase
MSENRIIGKNNKLPWYIPKDLQWFSKKTFGHPVIMGRKTYESIGKPLPGRQNIIITRKKDFTVPGGLVYHTLHETICHFTASENEEVFIIGGETVFKLALKFVNRIYLTLIHKIFGGDTSFPEIPVREFKTVFEEKHHGQVPFTFYIMERVKMKT